MWTLFIDEYWHPKDFEDDLGIYPRKLRERGVERKLKSVGG